MEGNTFLKLLFFYKKSVNWFFCLFGLVWRPQISHKADNQEFTIKQNLSLNYHFIFLFLTTIVTNVYIHCKTLL